MKLTQIRHCVAVAERGNLHECAQDLGVSRKTLQRSIHELERELGSPLFKRGNKTMTLTPVGEIFVRRAAAAQRELDLAIQALHDDPGSSPERDRDAGAHIDR